MQQTDKTKLCPSCDGYVALQVNICPYCGNSVFENIEHNSDKKKSENVHSLSYEETLASLYPPPYKPKVIEPEIKEEIIERKQDIEEEIETEEEEVTKKSFLLPTTLFLFGVNILFFSLILLIFSDDGSLYLKWNAKYWYLYTLFSIPLAYFGFKGLKD